MTRRTRLLVAALALLASTVLAGCDWDPTLCVGKRPNIAICV